MWQGLTSAVCFRGLRFGGEGEGKGASLCLSPLLLPYLYPAGVRGLLCGRRVLLAVGVAGLWGEYEFQGSRCTGGARLLPGISLSHTNPIRVSEEGRDTEGMLSSF